MQASMKRAWVRFQPLIFFRDEEEPISFSFSFISLFFCFGCIHLIQTFAFESLHSNLFVKQNLSFHPSCLPLDGSHFFVFFLSFSLSPLTHTPTHCRHTHTHMHTPNHAHTLSIIHTRTHTHFAIFTITTFIMIAGQTNSNPNLELSSEIEILFKSFGGFFANIGSDQRSAELNQTFRITATARQHL